MIVSKTIYQTMGREFRRFEDAVEFREGLIDKFLDDCPGFYQLLLKDRIAFVQSILDRREELINLLSYSNKMPGELGPEGEEID